MCHCVVSCVVLTTETIIDKNDFILKTIFSNKICVIKETKSQKTISTGRTGYKA